MSRSFYALVYAYGRHIDNVNGQRADHVYKFKSEAERTRFIDECDDDADPVKATHPLVKKALRYAQQGLDWPQAV